MRASVQDIFVLICLPTLRLSLKNKFLSDFDYEMCEIINSLVERISYASVIRSDPLTRQDVYIADKIYEHTVNVWFSAQLSSFNFPSVAGITIIVLLKISNLLFFLLSVYVIRIECWLFAFQLISIDMYIYLRLFVDFVFNDHRFILIFFLSNTCQPYVRRYLLERKPLEQITMNRPSPRSSFSIDNTHQFTHIEDETNSIVGVLPFFLKSIHAWVV